MTETSSLEPSEKLRIALELYESGVAMMRETLKRENPEAELIRLSAWTGAGMEEWVRWLQGKRGSLG